MSSLRALAPRALIVLLSVVSSSLVLAQTGEAVAPDADARVQEAALLARLQKLEEALDKAPPPRKSEAASVSVAPGKGLTVKSADDRFSFGLRARAQLRETYTQLSTSNTNEVQVRTLRLVVHGNVLSPDLKYNLQLALGGGDFDRENASPIFDAFIDYTRFRDVNIRVGQFFVPFDRARTIREFALQLVDRQQVVRELSLDRDVGIMFSSTNLFGLSDVLGYHLFLGGGDGRNRLTAVKTGPIGVLRLVVRPFGLFDDDQEGDLTREKRPRLAIGIAAGRNVDASKTSSTTGTVLTAGTTQYDHAAIDLVFKYGGFSLLTEALWRRADVGLLQATVNSAPVREWTRSGAGYFVQGGFLVTSKLELTARWEELFALRNTDPALIQLARVQGRQLGGGFNYYLNGHAFKIQGDVFRVFGVNGVQRVVGRLQLDASF